MLSILIQFIFVHYAFILIAKKYGVQSWLQRFSQKLGAKKWTQKLGKFIYNVSECSFCLTHHIAVLLLPFLFMENGFNWVFFIFPLMSTGALFLITGHKENEDK